MWLHANRTLDAKLALNPWSNIKRTQNRIPERKYCPITGMLAKYFDPVTQTPYANLRAFKIIRETMNKQLEKQKKNEEKKAEEKKKDKSSPSSKATPSSKTSTNES